MGRFGVFLSFIFEFLLVFIFISIFFLVFVDFSFSFFCVNTRTFNSLSTSKSTFRNEMKLKCALGLLFLLHHCASVFFDVVHPMGCLGDATVLLWVIRILHARITLHFPRKFTHEHEIFRIERIFPSLVPLNNLFIQNPDEEKEEKITEEILFSLGAALLTNMECNVKLHKLNRVWNINKNMAQVENQMQNASSSLMESTE